MVVVFFFCDEHTFATVFCFIFCSGSNRVINETTAAFAYRNFLFFIYRYDGVLVVYAFIVCRYCAGCCGIACFGCDFYGLFDLEVVENLIRDSEFAVWVNLYKLRIWWCPCHFLWRVYRSFECTRFACAKCHFSLIKLNSCLGRFVNGYFARCRCTVNLSCDCGSTLSLSCDLAVLINGSNTWVRWRPWYSLICTCNGCLERICLTLSESKVCPVKLNRGLYSGCYGDTLWIITACKLSCRWIDTSYCVDVCLAWWNIFVNIWGWSCIDHSCPTFTTLVVNSVLFSTVWFVPTDFYAVIGCLSFWNFRSGYIFNWLAFAVITACESLCICTNASYGICIILARWNGFVCVCSWGCVGKSCPALTAFVVNSVLFSTVWFVPAYLYTAVYTFNLWNFGSGYIFNWLTFAVISACELSSRWIDTSYCVGVIFAWWNILIDIWGWSCIDHSCPTFTALVVNSVLFCTFYLAPSQLYTAVDILCLWNLRSRKIRADCSDNRRWYCCCRQRNYCRHSYW